MPINNKPNGSVTSTGSQRSDSDRGTPTPWSYAGLHFAILTWGAAGNLAKLMLLPAAGIVFYRSLIAALILWLYNRITLHETRTLAFRDRKYLLATGSMIGIHWLGFFTAVKISTVSIALICISSAPIFVAVLQSWTDRVPISRIQIMLGLCSAAGICVIFKFESRYWLGIIIGLSAGAVDAIYSVMTSRTRAEIPSSVVTQMHMVGACLTAFLTNALWQPDFGWLILKTRMDLIGILFLGIVCSAVSMSLYVVSIKRLSAFSATLSLNLEAVYGIVLAIVLFGSGEYLSLGFYIGGLLLVGSVIVDSLLRTKPAKVEVAL